MEYVKVSKPEYEQLLLYKHIINYVEDELHQNKQMKDEFIQEIEQISEDVKKGKKTSFKNKEEMNAYLDRL